MFLNTKQETGIILFIGILMVSCKLAIKEPYVISSPDNKVQIVLINEEGAIKYSLSWQGQEMMYPSEIAILPGAKTLIKGTSLSTVDQSWKPVWGQFDKIRDYYNQLTLDLEIDGIIGKLYVRVFNCGIGFRYELEKYQEGQEAILHCEYNLAIEDRLYFPAGEREPAGPLTISYLNDASTEIPDLKLPLVVERPNQKYMAMLESDLYSAEGFNIMNLSFNKENGTLESDNPTILKDEKTKTPWRVILLGETPGDLVVNTVPVNLAAPSEIEDPSWIKPGKTLWDWRVHGYKASDGFTYGINTESYMRFIDFAAENRIDYFLIDDAWYTDINEGHIEHSDKLDLPKVSQYAKDRGVDLILYYDRRHGSYGDEALFSHYKELGMKGIKYGFMGTNVPFTRNAIFKSAKNQLIIDFHDSPVPFTGIQRTLPNAITREYCHAQQDSRRAFTPEAFIKMALINSIQGPLDMNNGNFDIVGINKGNRQKGPRKQGSYFTTVTSEAARTLIIFSGLVCIPDAPEAYAAKADLFEFIQQMPVGRWDDSKVLHSKIGEYISTARRHNKSWFIGSVVSQKGGTLPITLDFLEEGIIYNVTFYEDTKETHCKTNPEAYQVRQDKIKKGDVIEVVMAPGGGHAMWIRPE